MKDPNELLDDICKNKKNNTFFALKRLMWLIFGIRLLRFYRWTMNRCIKCGVKLVYYNIRKGDSSKRIKICEYCVRINPRNIVTEHGVCEGLVKEEKVYAGPLNKYVLIIIAVLFFALFYFSIYVSIKDNRKIRLDNGRQYISPNNNDVEYID